MIADFKLLNSPDLGLLIKYNIIAFRKKCKI